MVKMIKELGRRMNAQRSEKFFNSKNRYKEHNKKKKNTITKMENIHEGIKNRLSDTEK